MASFVKSEAVLTITRTAFYVKHNSAMLVLSSNNGLDWLGRPKSKSAMDKERKGKQPRNESHSALGNHLRALRAARALTLREVEASSSVSNAYISQLEQGKISSPSPHILQKLANSYGVPCESLLQRAGYMTERASGPLELAPAAAGSVSTSRRSRHAKSTSVRRVPASLGEISAEEEEELLRFLAFLRSKQK